MPPIYRQIASLVLPTLAVQVTGALTENVADAVVHTSEAFPLWSLQEKTVYAYATIALGAPAPLNVWIELAPWNVAALYVALGVPTVIAATGNAIIPWTTHSEWARVIVQCPGWVAGLWVVFIWFEAKGP